MVGWTISDVSSKRHTFGGTILWPGQAIVVYGKTPPAGINNAIASSTGYLSLNNSGETITLKNAGGEVKDTVTYSKSKEGISLNREKDGKAGTILVNHNTISQHPMSPGQKTDLSQW